MSSPYHRSPTSTISTKSGDIPCHQPSQDSPPTTQEEEESQTLLSQGTSKGGKPKSDSSSDDEETPQPQPDKETLKPQPWRKSPRIKDQQRRATASASEGSSTLVSGGAVNFKLLLAGLKCSDGPAPVKLLEILSAKKPGFKAEEYIRQLQLRKLLDPKSDYLDGRLITHALIAAIEQNIQVVYTDADDEIKKEVMDFENPGIFGTEVKGMSKDSKMIKKKGARDLLVQEIHRRIIYYGIRIDEKGKLVRPNHWGIDKLVDWLKKEEHSSYSDQKAKNMIRHCLCQLAEKTSRLVTSLNETRLPGGRSILGFASSVVSSQMT